ETRAAIAKVDLCKQPRPPAPRVVILDREDLPGADAWAAKLTELGAAVEVRRVTGYVEMMLDPHKTVVPKALIGAVVDAVEALGVRPAAVPTVPALAATARFGEVEEQALHLPGGAFGLLSSPTGAAHSSRAFLLLNSGAIHHVGPNRLWTRLARQWAA